MEALRIQLQWLHTDEPAHRFQPAGDWKRSAYIASVEPQAIEVAVMAPSGTHMATRQLRIGRWPR